MTIQTIQLSIDTLLDEQCDLIAGRRIGLVANPTSVDRDLVSTLERFRQHPELTLAALFGPEHGLRGIAQAGDGVDATIDPTTGIPEYSLYGETHKPTAAMLAGLDVLVYDLQVAGSRFFTYAATLVNVMEAAAEHGLPVIVLDRPNPLGGEKVEGGVLDMAYRSFVGIAPIPVRHGMTIGELARFCNDQLGIGCDLNVIPMGGWQRHMWYDDTDLPFVSLSPNLPTLAAVTLYPGTCFFEGTNLSEGRGTTRPFEYIGAPWLDAATLARALNALGLPGVRFRPYDFLPVISKHQGVPCHGVQVYVTNRSTFCPVETGLHLLDQTRRANPDAFEWVAPTAESGRYFIDLLSGGDTLRTHLDAGRPVAELAAAWASEARGFKATRRPYLLYL